jgi:hypothetical protein
MGRVVGESVAISESSALTVTRGLAAAEAISGGGKWTKQMLGF